MNAERFKRKLRRIRRKGEMYKKEQEVRNVYAEYWPDRRKRKVSNIMLVIIVVAIMAYTIASFWVQYKTGVAIDATLSTLYYGFWTVELISLTTIKNSKTKYGTDDHDNTCS